MKPIRAVTFDAGGTLIEPWPSVGAVYAEVAGELGLQCDPERLTAAFGEAWRNRVSFAYTRAEWFEVVRQCFHGSCDVSQTLFDAIYARFGESRSWRLYDDVLPTLERLRHAGVPLAVISNWDERLTTLLEQLGLASYFDFTLVSTTVGVHKPSPEIFHKAANRLGLASSEILHIGDSDAEDVHGALAAGFQARRIRRQGVSREYDLPSLGVLADDALQQRLPR